MAEYIEREALLKKAIEERRFVFQMADLINNEVVFQTVYKDLAEFILSVPAADVAPVAELRAMLSNLENKCCGDGTETYTTGYRNGHRNGQIELLRYILQVPDGTSEDERKGGEG